MQGWNKTRNINMHNVTTVGRHYLIILLPGNIQTHIHEQDIQQTPV